MTTARHTSSAGSLLRRAAGGPHELAVKARRLARALASFRQGAVIDERLDKLHALGVIEAIPTKIQLFVGGMDMLRFWISPAAAEYYRDQGLSFAFHQLLRVLDDPTSMIDPVGFLSERDAIIGHLMQVVHANPMYDLQLLQSFDGGLDELERQLEQMIAGTHPRAESIGAIVEEPQYHGELLRSLRKYREAPDAVALLRSNIRDNPTWEDLERTFGSLTAAMRYFRRMPEDPLAGAIHLLTVREFPRELAEPAA